MNRAWKAIGVATGAILLFFGSAAVTGHVLAERTDSQGYASASSAREDVLPATLVDEGAGQREDIAGGDESAEAATASQPAPSKDHAFVIKRVLPIDGPIRYGEWHWDETGAPEAGKLVVTVDLDARVISVFRDGYEIGAAAVLLGTDDHPTPLGTFPILQKRKDHVSNLYDAPMPYMMRLTWDGISIHGSQVENGYASHGCIGTPEPFARKLFAIAKLGDETIITRGKMVSIGDSLAGG